MTSKALGFPPQEPEADKESRVLVIPKDGKDAVMYKGKLKYDSLVPFLDSLAKGELDLDTYPIADAKVVEEGEKEVKEAMDRNETFEEDEKQEHKGKKKSKKESMGAGSEEL
ncbi:hypothetical protein BKA62DRAFT_365355 [Auriculariales sp. MPI-PUGE-AT-0066]|nr:hypothetical protein BKA62DRAFT_365355 [Auriculariales sp. MPI-PUGE-AT-0066]